MALQIMIKKRIKVCGILFNLEYFDTANIIPSTLSVTSSFVAFLINDIYGYVNWNRMKKRQAQKAVSFINVKCYTISIIKVKKNGEK